MRTILLFPRRSANRSKDSLLAAIDDRHGFSVKFADVNVTTPEEVAELLAFWRPDGCIVNNDRLPAESFAGYWKAAYTDVGGTPVPARLLGDETDLYIEGSSAILGGPTLGDTQVKLTWENGALTSDIEGVKVRVQFQADGCLRLTVTGNESAPQTWYMALAGCAVPEGENQ